MFTSKTGLTCRASMSVTVKLRTEKYSKVFTPKLCLVQKIMSAQFPARLRLDPWILDVLCSVPSRHGLTGVNLVIREALGSQPTKCRQQATIGRIPACHPVTNSNLSHIMMQKNIQVSDRRKFRSQTSDNMERWKAEQGRGREKRKIRREKIRRERVRRKKMQMREKVGKSRNTVFFQWFVAPESRKVGSLKRRVRSQLARWEMKNCTPLWREAHFQVKMHKTPQLRTTFGSWDVEKVYAVVARSTFRSQNVQNTSAPDHFWK